jgi:hypothetical protein
LRPPRRRIKHRRGIGDHAIARLRENGRSVWCRRLLRTRTSPVAAKVGAKVCAEACPAERQARVRMHGGRGTGGARSQPMQQALHGATIER